MPLLDKFGIWVWERHQNVLSWYIRPLFALPLAYYSYRRSLLGIVGTLVALATSMFWFPKPKQVDPRVAEFLRVEQAYLAGPWTTTKILSSPAVPLALGAFCLAFWRRSMGFGLFVFNAMWLAKVSWSVTYDASGRAILRPALVGLVVCNAGFLAVARLYRRRSRL